MLVQCPPCSTRYRISAQRIGADGRALSRCVACGTWLVVHRLDSGLLEIRTADELVGKRSILALDYADWAESVADRETMPMSLAADELPDDAFLSAPDGGDLGVLRIEAEDGPSDWRPRLESRVEASPPPVAEVQGGSFFPAGAVAAPELPAAGPDLGALALEMPDPRQRRRSRVEVQAMLSEFSVMFRLDNRAKRRRTMIAAGGAIAICAVLVAVVLLRGGAVTPATSAETHTLVTTLQANHTDAVEHAGATLDKDGKPVRHKLSLLATQLLRLGRAADKEGPDEDAPDEKTPVSDRAARPTRGSKAK